MITTSKKNIANHSKPQSQHSKTLKRSKSTQQILPKKVSKKVERSATSETKNTLAKSKSTKSLKSKPRPASGSIESSAKKGKSKKSTTKTVKKQIRRETNQFSSLTSEDWETKKPGLEYFIYHNNYISIQNSAQRRLVYKIQMIDLQNNSTATSFNLKKDDVPVNTKKEDASISTQTPIMQNIAVGNELILRTQDTQTQSTKYAELPQRCFGDLLTELQFLYLPNENIYAPFTQNQRIHYSELLQSLAKKILGEKGAVVNEATLSDEQITVLLYQRQGIQIGALQFIPLQGFPTHLLSILAYLKNLFCFLQYGFKEDVLSNLRMFYGYNYNQRIRRLSRGLPHQKDKRPVLGEDLFEAFENQMFKDYEFDSDATKQAVHYHNKAIFDVVNDQLQAFRPFYSSQGEPFPWAYNLGMTHYDITEEALYIIFVQIKEKIQKHAISLCGMQTDFDDESLPSPNNSKLYQKKMKQREDKMLHEQLKNTDDKVALDYQISAYYFQLSSEIVSDLMEEFVMEFRMMKEDEGIEEVFQFQYFN